MLQLNRRLRERDEPIKLFGETDAEAYARLKKLELMMPEVIKVRLTACLCAYANTYVFCFTPFVSYLHLLLYMHECIMNLIRTHLNKPQSVIIYEPATFVWVFYFSSRFHV